MDGHFIGVFKTIGTIRSSKENDEWHEPEMDRIGEILLSGPTTIDRNRCSSPRKQNTPVMVEKEKRLLTMSH